MRIIKRDIWRLASCLMGALASNAGVFAAEAQHFELPPNADGQPISFVSCPVVQDTSTVPCWFADQADTRYFIGIQQDIGADFHPPQLNHRVLVEGRLLEAVELCGAPVIHPVTISVLPEIDRACNDLLPAMPGVEPPPHERGPGPSNDGLEPRERTDPPQPPVPPFEARTFVVPFTFDSAVMRGTVTREISQAMTYARNIEASRLEIVTYRASSLLNDGQELVEREDMAAVRAEALQTIFREAGFPAGSISVSSQEELQRGDGTEDFLLRRAEITVVP